MLTPARRQEPSGRENGEAVEKITADLLEELQTAGGGQQAISVIVHLTGESDWSEALQHLTSLGFSTSAEAREIGAISGSASAEAVRRISALPEVRLVERDATATAQ